MNGWKKAGLIVGSLLVAAVTSHVVLLVTGKKIRLEIADAA